MDMIFDNKLITQLINIKEVVKQPFPNRKINSVGIPNRNGVYFQGAYFGERTITVEFTMIYDFNATITEDLVSDSMFNNVVRSLMFYLTTDAPAKLVFSDEPTKYYWAIVENVDLNRLFQLGEGTITFKCLDCFAYATELKTYQMEDGTLKVYNYGTANAYPTFTIQFSQPTKSFTIVTKDAVIQIGDPNTIDNEDWVYTNQRIHTDNLYDLTKWYYGNQQLLTSGDSSGRILDESIVFAIGHEGEVAYPTNLGAYTDNVGTGSYKGGFMLTNLDKNPMYWKTTIQFEMSSRKSFNSSNNPQQLDQMGIIEFIGYDVNNVELFRLSMRDYHKKMTHNEVFWYLGNSNLIYKSGTQTAKTTYKTYTQRIEGESENLIPENAVILTDIEKATHTFTASKFTNIYASASSKSKIITTITTGTQLLYKGSSGNWYQVYLNNERTLTGYVSKNNGSVEQGGTDRIVTYKVPTTANSSGKYNDWWGRFELTRKKYNDGSVWELAIKRCDFVTGKQTTVYTKTVTDENDKYTSGTNLAKIGVFIGSYLDAEPCGRMCFNYIGVNERIEEFEGNENHYIAEEGDVIEINCDEQMIYKNGDEFMEMLDVGSDFVQLKPFSETEVQVITDDENYILETTVQERFI